MTVELPRALSPWADELALFPHDLAVGVGDVVARIASLVGPFERPSRASAGEPDGVTGLARRGSFDRLVPTEWALLNEVPTEFLRRFASGELAYFDPARREPSEDRKIVALFDAGVGQLGAPRVVHLAILVLLAQRARKADARFAWGVLQAPPLPVEGLTRTNVGALLHGRTRRALEPADVRRWSVALRLDENGRHRDLELWVVSGPRAPEIARVARRIVVEEPLDPLRPSSVAVRVEIPERPTRTAIVDLPDARASVRLLRDPFHEPTPPRRFEVSLEPGRLVFSPDGRKLYARSGDALLSLPIFRGAPERALPRAFESRDAPIVAVGQPRASKRTWVLLHAADGLHLCTLSKRGDQIHGRQRLGPPPPALSSELHGPLGQLLPLANGEAIVPSRAGLVRIGQCGPSMELEVPLAKWSVGHATAQLVTDEASPRLLLVRADASARLHVDENHALEGVPWGAAFAFTRSLDAFAYENADGAWTVRNRADAFDVEIGPHEHVVGVSHRGPRAEPHLVLLDGLGRICAATARDREVLGTFERRVVHAQVSEHDRLYAALTMDGRLVIASTEDGAPIVTYRARAEGTR